MEVAKAWEQDCIIIYVVVKHLHSTVSVAVAEVLPTALEAMQVYWPPLAPVTMAMEYIGPLAPAIGAPWNCHDI